MVITKQKAITDKRKKKGIKAITTESHKIKKKDV